MAPSITTQLWGSALAALVSGRQTGSRSSAWRQLATYPAVLLAYCLGIGAAAGRGHDVLAWLFTSPLPNERGEWRPLVELIHPYTVDERIGIHLREARFRLSPFSDHLHAVTRPFFRDLLIRDDHFERAFDRFELLTSLARYHLPGASGSDVWMPLERVLGHGRYTENASRGVLQDEGAPTDAGSALLRAMGRDADTIDAALAGFHESAGKQLSRAFAIR